MYCPYCSNKETSVLESRILPDSSGMRRRRECKKCSKRFSTYEKVVSLDLKVSKKDGKVEDFDREKLLKGIRKACWKRKVTEEEMIEVVDDIELKLLNRQTTIVPSCDIGKMVMNRLKKLDSVAYLRFASVYLEFDSAEDFGKVINNLKEIQHAS